MSKKIDKNKSEQDEIIAFTEGSSVIDIGALRAAQNDGDELSLDDEAALLMEELNQDETLKTDVLTGFNAEQSDADLDQIALSVEKQTEADIAQMEALSLEVADELKQLNQTFISEDMALESAIEAEKEGLVEDLSEDAKELKAALPAPDAEGNYDLDDLQSCIEALLFYSDKPVSLKKLKEMLEMVEADDAPILQALELLKSSYQTKAHGFEVAEIAGGYQLRTKPNKAPLLRKLAKVQVQRLSRGAMETLTIVAYKQPCTKDDIDQVRGVDSSHFIRTLLDRNLIEVSGRSEAAGRPMIYSTTDTFLEVFGLMDLRGMPPLSEIEAMVPQIAASEAGAEDPRVIQMRKLVNQMKVESNHLDYDAKEDDKILQEIKDRVKSIDITTPYLARQKELAEQGITGFEAEEILTAEFKLKMATSGGEHLTTDEIKAITETLDPEASMESPEAGSLELSAEELMQIAEKANSDSKEF